MSTAAFEYGLAIRRAKRIQARAQKLREDRFAAMDALRRVRAMGDEAPHEDLKDALALAMGLLEVAEIHLRDHSCAAIASRIRTFIRLCKPK